MDVILWLLVVVVVVFVVVVLRKAIGSTSTERREPCTQFRSEIRGIFADRRRQACGTLRSGSMLVPVRDRKNPEDPNAVALYSDLGYLLGYLPREQVDEIAPLVDAGKWFKVRVLDVNRHSSGDVGEVHLICQLEGEHQVSRLRTRQERQQYEVAIPRTSL